MSAPDPNDLAATWGRELCALLAPYDDELTAQDAYEIFDAAMDRALSLDALQALTQDDLEAIAERARNDLANSAIPTDLIQEAVKQVLWHWAGD